MKIAILSSHTSSLFWFRLDMMKSFVQQGYTVIAVGPEPESQWSKNFENHKIIYRQISVKRNGINFFEDFRTLYGLYKLLNEERPDKIFAYQAKPVVYGSIAAKLNKINEFYPLIAGLGSIFRSGGFKSAVLKTILNIQYRIAFNASKKVFFQNEDDRNEMINNKIVSLDKTIIINGSGVNLEHFQPTPLPEQSVFLFIGRLIKDKGIMEYLEACKLIKKKYPDVQCLLVGPYDTNPSAIGPNELEPYIEQGIIMYFGEQRDVRSYISQSSTYVLPSYHEGTPKSVLEAMAMGRAVITTDAPGCRETVSNGINGFLVKVGNVQMLAEKMEMLILNPEMNKRMGEESLKLVNRKYDVKLVNHAIMKTMGII